MSGWGVAGRAGVDDRDPAPGPAQHESGGETGGSATDDHDVIGLGLPCSITSRRTLRSFVRVDNFCCRFWESMVGSRRWTRSTTINDVLVEVGPRLRRVRTQRDVTLTELAAATGISKSTLSRLESGQRKPSLELLLPIAQAHRIPLDELVGAPDIGDPADSAQAGEAQRRPDRRPPHTSTPRGARLEGGHPARTGQTAAAHARGL